MLSSNAGAPAVDRGCREDVLEDLGPLFHSFKFFGVSNRQWPNFVENQKAKEPIIRAYIQYAIAKSRKSIADPVTFAELFCADGYFAMLARLLGASESRGIDNGRDGYSTRRPRLHPASGSTESTSAVWTSTRSIGWSRLTLWRIWAGCTT